MNECINKHFLMLSRFLQLPRQLPKRLPRQLPSQLSNRFSSTNVSRLLTTKPQIILPNTQLIYPQTRLIGTQSNEEQIQQPRSLSNLILDIPRIREMCGAKGGLHGIALVGNQSSGKTSLLEHLIGFDFFVKHSGVASKRPVQIKVYNISGDEQYLKFGEFGEKIYNMEIARKRFAELNNGDFNSEPIQITCFTPYVPDFLVTDFPGHYNTPKPGESKDNPKIVYDMSYNAICDDNTFKFLVMSATADRAASIPLKIIQDEKQFHNTCGVLTRCDLIVNPDPNDASIINKHGRQQLIDLLTDSDYSKYMEMIGVVLRSSADIKRGITIPQKLKMEQEFILSNKLQDQKMGVKYVREKMSQSLIAKTLNDLPELRVQIDNKIDDIHKEKKMLEELSTDDEESIYREVSAATEIMFDTLGNQAPGRVPVEEKIEAKVGDEIDKSVDRVFDNYYKLNKSGTVDFSRYTTKKNLNSREVTLKNQLRSIANNEMIYCADSHDIDKFAETHRHGLFSVPVENDEVEDAYLADLKIKNATYFCQFHLTHESKKNKSSWVRKLEYGIDDLVKEEGLAEKCRQVAIDTMLESVYELLPQSKNSKTNHFFKYIFTKISDQTANEGLVDSLKRNIYKEQSPYAEPWELAHYIENEITDDWKTHRGFFDSTESKLEWTRKYAIFSPEWTFAYKKCLTNRLKRDITRILKMNLSRPLVRNILAFQYKFFLNHDLKPEYEELGKKLQELTNFSVSIDDIEIEAKLISENDSKNKQRIQLEIEKDIQKEKSEKLRKERREKNIRF